MFTRNFPQSLTEGNSSLPFTLPSQVGKPLRICIHGNAVQSSSIVRTVIAKLDSLYAAKAMVLVRNLAQSFTKGDTALPCTLLCQFREPLRIYADWNSILVHSNLTRANVGERHTFRSELLFMQIVQRRRDVIIHCPGLPIPLRRD